MKKGNLEKRERRKLTNDEYYGPLRKWMYNTIEYYLKLRPKFWND